MIKLTEQELQALINVVSQVNVPVEQSPPFVELINKMSKMIDELKNSEQADA